MKIALKILMPLLILGGGAYAGWYMITHRPVVKQEEVIEPEIPVQVYTAERVDIDLVIHGSGEVLPAKQIMLQPQVSGNVVDVHSDFIPGGIFKKGDVLVKIDPRDFDFMVEQMKDRVEQAKMKLEEEVGRQTVAQREWNLLGNEVITTDAGKSLALREPHIRSAKTAVQAAESMLNDVKLDVERTVLRAPFNCWVMRENVDVGQVVNPQTQIATLVGTDQYWVHTKINAEDLAYIFIPGINAEEGSDVTVVHDAGSLQIELHGKITRLLGDMSLTGRQVQVLVEVDDPLGLYRKPSEEQHPLFLGAYVNTLIQGKKVRDVFSVPRAAVREGNRVWVRNEEGRLAIQEVEILVKREDDVIVTAGIHEGQQIVTSILATPLPGIKLVIDQIEDTGLGSIEIPEGSSVDSQ